MKCNDKHALYLQFGCKRKKKGSGNDRKNVFLVLFVVKPWLIFKRELLNFIPLKTDMFVTTCNLIARFAVN